MKNEKINMAMLAMVMAVLFAAAVYAQKGPGTMWHGSGGWEQGSPYNKMYDPKAVETITGEVTNVDRITPSKGMSAGLQMNVKTGKETIRSDKQKTSDPRKLNPIRSNRRA